MSAEGSDVAVGKVSKAHGTRGEVAVLVLSENPTRFAPGSVVHREDGRPLTVAEARPHGARLLVRFEEVPDRAAAEALRGATLLVPESALAPLPAGSYWPHELEGCAVVLEDGRELGTLREVLHTAANDIWVAEREGRETLVPAIRDVIVEVDLGGRRVVVRAVPGVTSPEKPPRS